MTFFTSQRERRLWGWALAVVIAIYSTLSLAQKLAVVFSQSRLGDWLFILAFLLVLITILTQGLKVRPSGAEIGVAIGIAAAYLLVFARIAIPFERTHLIEYGVVAVFIFEALTERASHGRRVPVPALLAILITSLLGALDEVIQLFLPNRVFSTEDIFFNLMAGIMAVISSLALSAARQWWNKKRENK